MYSNFKTAFYFTNFDMQLGIDVIKEKFDKLQKYVHVDKVYIETYRSGLAVSQDVIEAYKTYFNKKGIKTSGGITLNKPGKNWFSSMCYQTDLERVIEIVKTCATYFDEIILDDFFFDNCRCSSCIKEKKDATWQAYRLESHARVSKLINEAIKTVNPNAKTIIKFPNWYESFAALGYNLKQSSQFFDGVYTGTETRDTVYTQQNLQGFNSYFLPRYIENATNKNMGGWIDTLDLDLNVFLDQVYLSLLSVCEELTLFSLGALLTKDFVYAPLLGHALERMDQISVHLKQAKGFNAYKPYNSKDDYLLTLFGMLGITLEPQAKWQNKDHVFLSKGAAEDPLIIEKLKDMMKTKSRIIMTTEFIGSIDFKELAEISIGDNVWIGEVAYNLDSCSYSSFEKIEAMMIKKIHYHTNDVFEEVVGLGHENSYPIVLKMFYDEGEVYILNIPNEPTDLKRLPTSVLNIIRELFFEPVQVEGDVSLIRYDQAMVLYSFNRCNTGVKLKSDMIDLETNEKLRNFILRPHEMKILKP